MIADDITQQTRQVPLYPQAPDYKLYPESLAQKFIRQSEQPKKILYEFTRDAGLLHQYYRLRDEMFIHAWGMPRSCGGQDAFDNKSQILVAKRGHQCIGGVRFSTTSPAHPRRLPMEGDGLSLVELFPELRLAERHYGELSRLAILPEYRTGIVFTEIMRALIKEAVAQGVDYVFSIAPQPIARAYRYAAQMSGITWEVRYDIQVPDREEYEGIRMDLSVMDIISYAPRRKSLSKQKKAQREPLLAD